MLIKTDNFPSALMQQQRIQVSDIGDKVDLVIGNNAIRMDYETALQVSGWLRMHAKRAKATAGDTSRQWRVLGMLEGLRA